MLRCCRWSLILVLSLVSLHWLVAAPAALAQPQPSFGALGQEIVEAVGEQFFDPEVAARWVEENAGYGEAITDADAFGRETNRRLAQLSASHTHYFRADDPGYHDLLAIFEPVLEMSPEHERIGLAAVERPEGWFVDRVFPGGPAAAAGLLRGDRLLFADGEPFHPVRSFAGRDGATVILEVQRNSGAVPLSVPVVPRRIHPWEEWRQVQRDGSRVVEVQGRDVAYVPVFTCAGEEPIKLLGDALSGELAEAEALVLDLRGGWGGCDPRLLNLFNPAVPQLTQIGRDGVPHRWAASWRRPLVVLIDGGSRSGKELVARGFQRSARATLVGERTAGAVVAGRIFRLSDDSLLYLAVFDVRVDGERLEGVGVAPDVAVAAELPWAAGADPQLDRALEVAAQLAAAAALLAGDDASP